MPQGGRRPGAGRPKGSLSAAINLEKARVRAEFDRRVMQQVDQLFHAQFTAAVGCTMLFKRARAGGHAVPVTSEAEVKWFIDNHEVIDGHARATDGSHYYWLTTERSSAEAVDRMLNRAFGKPVEQHAFTGEGEDGKPTTVRFVVVGGEDVRARCS